MKPKVISASKLSQDEISVLKRIKVLRKATPDSLAAELGEPYTLQGLSVYLKSLESRNLLSKSQENRSAYELTPLGLAAIGALDESAEKVYLPVPDEKSFHFYTGVGPDKFTKVSANSLYDFREKAKKIDVKSLEFHVRRGDISKWLNDVLGDAQLAKEFDRLRSSNLFGELLRTRILRLTDNRIERLTHERTRI